MSENIYNTSNCPQALVRCLQYHLPTTELPSLGSHSRFASILEQYRLQQIEDDQKAFLLSTVVGFEKLMDASGADDSSEAMGRAGQWMTRSLLSTGLARLLNRSGWDVDYLSIGSTTGDLQKFKAKLFGMKVNFKIKRKKHYTLQYLGITRKAASGNTHTLELRTGNHESAERGVYEGHHEGFLYTQSIFL